MAKSLKVLTRCGVLALLCLAGASSAANADVYWLVTGTFDDNTTLDAKLDINVYGYLEDWKAITQADGSFAAEEYTPDINASANPVPPSQTILFANTYFNSTLQLTFATDLGDAAHSPDALVGGVYPLTGDSFECQSSWDCGFTPPVGDPVRYLVSGVATSVSEAVYDSAVPEPGDWIMMLLGFGSIGLAMRGSRRKGAAVTA